MQWGFHLLKLTSILTVTRSIMVDDMKDGFFDWNLSSLQPVIIGVNGEVMAGHHRVIAAHLAGINLAAIPGPRPQVQYFLGQNFRPIYDWIDVLPDVIERKDQRRMPAKYSFLGGLWALNRFASNYGEASQNTLKWIR